MPVAFCFIPQDVSFRPAAADVARLLRFLLEDDLADNGGVYVDITCESGYHRPGTSDLVTLEAAADALEKADCDAAGFAVENIRGTGRIPMLFENADQRNLSLMGWLSVRAFDEPYPLIDSDADYRVTCAGCGAVRPQQEWASDGTARRCPDCGQSFAPHELEYDPKMEWARFIIEISDLEFVDEPPRLAPGDPLSRELPGILGTPLKTAWYHA